MSKLSILLLPQTTETFIISDKKRAAGYYGYSSGLHTISISINDFIGRIYIQGSLVDNPTENDWFNIKVNDDDYIEYNNITKTDSYSFNINMLWIRIKVDKLYLNPLPVNTGFIRKILLNY